MATNYEVLAVVSSRIEAELIAGRLKGIGVRVHVSADDEGGMNPAIQPGRVRILISPQDGAKARNALKELNLVDQVEKEPSRFQKRIWRLLGGQIPKGS